MRVHEREEFRFFIDTQLRPLTRRIEAELSEGLATPVSIDLTDTQRGDIVGRSRSFASLVKGGMEVSEAAKISGSLIRNRLVKERKIKWRLCSWAAICRMPLSDFRCGICAHSLRFFRARVNTAERGVAASGLCAPPFRLPLLEKPNDTRRHHYRHAPSSVTLSPPRRTLPCGAIRVRTGARRGGYPRVVRFSARQRPCSNPGGAHGHQIRPCGPHGVGVVGAPCSQRRTRAHTRPVSPRQCAPVVPRARAAAASIVASRPATSAIVVPRARAAAASARSTASRTRLAAASALVAAWRARTEALHARSAMTSGASLESITSLLTC